MHMHMYMCMACACACCIDMHVSSQGFIHSTAAPRAALARALAVQNPVRNRSELARFGTLPVPVCIEHLANVVLGVALFGVTLLNTYVRNSSKRGSGS